MAELKYTKAVLNKKTKAELEALLDEEGYEADSTLTKADIIETLLEVEVSEDDIEDELDEEELDDEELPDEDEEDDIEADEVVEVTKTTKKKSSTKKTDGEEGSTLAAKQVATLLGTEAKTLRQFFRSPASTIEPVGSGGRYEFLETDVPQITKEFEAWKAGHASRGAKRTGEGGTSRSRGKRWPKVAEVTEVEEVEELEIEELEDEELDDEELDLEDED